MVFKGETIAAIAAVPYYHQALLALSKEAFPQDKQLAAVLDRL